MMFLRLGLKIRAPKIQRARYEVSMTVEKFEIGKWYIVNALPEDNAADLNIFPPMRDLIGLPQKCVATRNKSSWGYLASGGRDGDWVWSLAWDLREIPAPPGKLTDWKWNPERKPYVSWWGKGCWERIEEASMKTKAPIKFEVDKWYICDKAPEGPEDETYFIPKMSKLIGVPQKCIGTDKQPRSCLSWGQLENPGGCNWIWNPEWEMREIPRPPSEKNEDYYWDSEEQLAWNPWWGKGCWKETKVDEVDEAERFETGNWYWLGNTAHWRAIQDRPYGENWVWDDKRGGWSKTIPAKRQKFEVGRWYFCDKIPAQSFGKGPRFIKEMESQIGKPLQCQTTNDDGYWGTLYDGESDRSYDWLLEEWGLRAIQTRPEGVDWVYDDIAGAWWRPDFEVGKWYVCDEADETWPKNAPGYELIGVPQKCTSVSKALLYSSEKGLVRWKRGHVREIPAPPENGESEWDGKAWRKKRFSFKQGKWYLCKELLADKLGGYSPLGEQLAQVGQPLECVAADFMSPRWGYMKPQRGNSFAWWADWTEWTEISAPPSEKGYVWIKDEGWIRKVTEEEIYGVNSSDKVTKVTIDGDLIVKGSVTAEKPAEENLSNSWDDWDAPEIREMVSSLVADVEDLRAEMDGNLLNAVAVDNNLAEHTSRLVKLETKPPEPEQTPLLWNRITGEGPFIEVSGREGFEDPYGRKSYYRAGMWEASTIQDQGACLLYPDTLVAQRPPFGRTVHNPNEAPLLWDRITGEGPYIEVPMREATQRGQISVYRGDVRKTTEKTAAHQQARAIVWRESLTHVRPLKKKNEDAGASFFTLLLVFTVGMLTTGGLAYWSNPLIEIISGLF